MDKNDPTVWTGILQHPGLTPQTAAEDLYRAACIGAVTLLYESGDTAALADCVRRAASPESRARALFALETLSRAAEPVRSRAIRELYRLAAAEGHKEAADFLRRSGLLDTDPGWNSAGRLLFGQKHQLLKADPGPEALSRLFLEADAPFRHRLLELSEQILPHWTLLMRFLDDPENPEHRAALTDNYKKFTPEERKLLRLCTEQGPDASSIAADIFLRLDDETAREICLQNDLRPSDRSREALFYFLSGQWEQYYASDSDYRRIRLAYEEKDPELQRRLISVSRESGNSGWLRMISSGPDNIPNSGTLSDQHLLVRSLIEQEQWERLWELLPNLPLLCMPAACSALKAAGFRPKLPEERDFLEELNARIIACEGLSPIPLRQKMAENSGTAIGICGRKHYTAVLYSDRRILLWDKRSEFSAPDQIISNQLNFRRAVISHDGKYLCADCGKDGIVIFTLPGGQVIKTLTNSGVPLSGSYLQPDDRRLITLDQNGKGIIYAFPGGSILHSFDLGIRDCSRAVWDPQSSRICGVTPDGKCGLYDLISRQLITILPLDEPILAIPEHFSRGRLSLITKGERFSTVNLLSGKAVMEPTDTGNEAVRRLIEPEGMDVCCLGTLGGHIRIFDPAAAAVCAELSFGTKSAVTGMWYDRETSTLYGCTGNGSVRSWDLSLFRDMARVLPLMQLPGLNRINDFCKTYPEPGVKAAAEWLKTVVLWRRRFDIEVDFGD